MKQLNNGFKDYYYLTVEGDIYNKEKDKIIKADSQHRFRLILENGKKKSISLKSIYYIVYNSIYCKDNIKDLQGEIWKPIERTNNIYWISNKGRVKSLKGYEAIILKPNYSNGYARVDLFYDDGSRSSKLISRLVASAFLPLPQNIDMELHHINNVKADNRAENLIWLTQQDHKAIHKKGDQKINATENSNGSEPADINNK